ncbi:MAG: BACON domain-containing protein [Chloroflexi bacterium]|nr:BACON domain-containing protein [Chloroflexota bacterium]MBM4450541.1 BACON domain-containing protein [Chloroflexota bacterium]
MSRKFFRLLLLCLSLVLLTIPAIQGHVFAQQSSESDICVENIHGTMGTGVTSGGTGLEHSKLSVSTTSLDFGSASTRLTFKVVDSGTFAAWWELSTMQSWISLSPAGGKGNKNITVSVDRSGLKPGDYKGYITLTGLSESARHIIIVYMRVPSSGAGPSSTSKPLEKSRVVFSVPGAASVFISIYDTQKKLVTVVGGQAQSSGQIITAVAYLPDGNYSYSAGGKVQKADGVAKANFTVRGTTYITVRLISAGYIPKLP